MEYLESILTVLGILFLTFVIIPWVGMVIIGLFMTWWKENDRFDG